MQVQYTKERTVAEVCTIRTKIFVLCANQIVPWTKSHGQTISLGVWKNSLGTRLPSGEISINDSTLASVCYTVIYMVRVGLGLG